MEKSAESKICSSLCFFKPSLLSPAVLFPSVVFTCSLVLGFSPLFVTIPILFLSTALIIRFSKKKVVIVENPAQEESPTCCPQSLHQPEKEVKEQLNTLELGETVAQCNATMRSEVSHVHEYQVEATDFPSDSESSDDFSASGNFELSWACTSNMGQNVVLSESSDDDQDGDYLIEISLPKNTSVDFNEVSRQKVQSNLPDYLPESIFSQEGLMELLAEINEANEEENLIEIDLSLDSIKSSGFEIKE